MSQDLSKTIQDERYTRYSGVIDPLLLAKAHCTVIGCGAIGRQVAMQLASMGVGALTLIDHDKVEPLNLGCQGWSPKDVGQTKAEALAASCLLANPTMTVKPLVRKFEPEDARSEGCKYLFSCVDNMDVRKMILESSSPMGTDLFAEGRMTPEVFQVNFVYDSESREAWLKGWFPQKEAPEQTCSTRTTLHCACAAAAAMVQGFTKCLRQHVFPYKVDVNLAGFSMSCEWPAPEPLAEEVGKAQLVAM